MRSPVDVDAQIPNGARVICDRLHAQGFGAWVVGGCVRDVLLERAIKDWDICTQALPEKVIKIFRRVVPTGLKFGTVTVLLDDGNYEVTTLRADREYLDGRRPESVNFVNDIREDLSRRDFTINAIAYNVNERQLIDPFGGENDLRKRLIRAVGDPALRFSEDALRLMRAARFVGTLDFDIEPTTKAAAIQCHEGLRKVSKERIRDELFKAMLSTMPSRALEAMRTLKLLDVFAPFLLDQVGCPQNRYHAFDVWTHTMHTVDAIPISDQVVTLRCAALLHDIAKPETSGISPKTHDVTFFHHEHVGAKKADAWMKTMKFSNQMRELIVHLIQQHLVAYDDNWSDAAVRRFIQRVGVDRLDALFQLLRADTVAKGTDVQAALQRVDRLLERVNEQLRSKAPTEAKALAVRGDEVMQHLGIKPGPIVGQALKAALDYVIEHPEANQKAMLLNWIEEYVRKTQAS